MDAECEHPRVIVECVLDAVAVMGIDIQVDDALQTLIEPCQNGENRIIDVAKSRSAIRAAMMIAAAWAMHKSAVFGD